LQDLAQTLDLKKLFGFYELLLRCKRQLSTTVNKQLMFEEILIHWSQLNTIH
jgi:DNA polymerase-3 subunit delta'